MFMQVSVGFQTLLQLVSYVIFDNNETNHQILYHISLISHRM